MGQALRLHSAYWAADEDRAQDPAGHTVLAPLATACFAYYGGIPIGVESHSSRNAYSNAPDAAEGNGPGGSCPG
ncbi:Imm49 family immunity protein [Streptomyces yangpuensis]|uniref:Imm49 family immunity protein n=1 Tax=Streptomyces yangpuensis TaxID=1648182 RepID=UPI003715BB48